MRSPELELETLDSQSLRRTLSVPGEGVRNFSGNDYLGMSRHPELLEVYAEAVRRLGAGSGSSRLVCGTSAEHLALEETVADFKNAEAALTFSTGYAASVGTLTALAGRGDVLILDKLSHASLVDGARLSGAEIRVYPHNELDRLEHLLRWARGKATPESRILVVTESRFSMDGDTAPIREIVRLKDEFGALLLLDEAHAFGIDGPHGAGLAAAEGVSSRVDLQMGTLSKAAGLSGGFLAASRGMIDLVTNRARSFIYSTAPAPALAVAAQKSVDLLRSVEGDRLREALRERIHAFRSGLDHAAEGCDGPIQPVAVGGEGDALELSAALRRRGFFVPAIRYPTVARGAARLRVTLSAVHSEEEIEGLVEALADCRKGAAR